LAFVTHYKDSVLVPGNINSAEEHLATSSLKVLK
jgi:hypothetical protein